MAYIGEGMTYIRKSYWAQLAVVFVSYFATARTGLMMDNYSGFATLVWPPSGIALAALLVGGYRMWPAVFASAFAVNFLAGGPFWVTILMALGNSLEAIVGTYLLHQVNFDKSFSRVRDVLRFLIFAVLISTMVSATLGTLALELGNVEGFQGYWSTWRVWWVGDILGELIVAPVLLVPLAHKKLKLRTVSAAENFLFSFCLILAGIAVYGGILGNLGIPDLTLSYLFFPFVIWAALRMGLSGTTLTIFIISIISIVGTAEGFGPFTYGPLRDNLLFLHSFLSVLSVTGLVLAASICERVQATDRAKKGEIQKGIFLTATLDAFVSIDVDGNVTEFNPAAERMFGYKREEILGREMAKYIIPTKWREFHRQKFHAATRSNKIVSIERNTDFSALRKDGTEFPIELTVRTVPYTDSVKYIGYIRDITIQKQAKFMRERNDFLAKASALLASSLNYEETLQGLAHLVVPELADWCIVDVNEKEGLPPRNIAMAFPNTEKLQWAKNLQKKFPRNWNASKGAANVLKTGRSEFYPHVTDDLLTAAAIDDEHLTILRHLKVQSAMMVPLTSRDKVYGAITFLSSDSGKIYNKYDLLIAEELGRKAALALENSILFYEAQKAIRTRDEFLSIASHELKTPLTSLSLQIQLMQKTINNEGKLPSVEKLVKVFDLSHKQVQRLNNLIEDLLDVSRIQAGRLSFNFEQINLSETVTDMANRFTDLLAKAGCEVVLNIQKNVIGRFDLTRIEQVIDNLISNILKYAPGGKIEVSLKTSDDKAILSFRDSGPGISAEAQNVIFERFSRATNSNVSGLGLGLYIVSEIVKGHQGKIRLESTVNQGSNFIIELPLKMRKTQPAALPEQAV